MFGAPVGALRKFESLALRDLAVFDEVQKF